MAELDVPAQYDSLPDVPAPQETPATRGHAAPASFLASAYREGKLPHALLFAGPRGVGKATLAFQFARHLLAFPDATSAPGALVEPDLASPLFRQVASGAHPGVLHLSRPWDEKVKKFKTAITVDEVRAISRFVGLTAHDGGYRIVIVDAADDMNRNAANALLKNLEEPPARTVFLLISHAPGRLLPTIRSRCQFIRFNPLEEHAVQEILESLPAAIDPRMRDEAVACCGGSAREAILLAQFGGLEIGTAVGGFVERARFDVAEAYRISAAVSGKGNDVQFELFNSAVLALLAAQARDAAQAGEQTVAVRYSQLWQETNRRIGETTAYNLDRKQHVLSVLADLNAHMRN